MTAFVNSSTTHAFIAENLSPSVNALILFGNDMSKLNMTSTKLKKGDEVVVLNGRAKGLTGKIDRLDLKNAKVYIGGVNLFKKHLKPSANNPESGIIDKPMPLHVSNVAFVDPKTKKATKLGYQMQGDRKVRIAKVSGTVL